MRRNSEKNIFVDDPGLFTDKCPCLIKVVIQEAEDLMRERLKTRSLRWLHDQVEKDFTAEKKKTIAAWARDLF